MKVEAKDAGGRVLLVDRLPAGFEIENPRIVDSGDVKALDWLKTTVQPEHSEFRDDRFVAAFNFSSAGRRAERARRNDRRRGHTEGPATSATVAYMVRAVTPGAFVHPAATVEDMYRPERYARSAAGKLDVCPAVASVRYVMRDAARNCSPSPGGEHPKAGSRSSPPALAASLPASGATCARTDRRRHACCRRHRVRRRRYIAIDRLGPPNLETTSQLSITVLDRRDRLLRAFTTPDGRWRLPVEAADVDQRYLAMLMAFEDKRFYEHGGIDIRSLTRAALQLVENGRIVSGGSTLTMQVARLSRASYERSGSAQAAPDRRRAAARASSDEAADPRPCTCASRPFGGNIEGVRAASLAYFGKEPRRLSVGEAALLVALPQSPEMAPPRSQPATPRASRATACCSAPPRKA